VVGNSRSLPPAASPCFPGQGDCMRQPIAEGCGMPKPTKRFVDTVRPTSKDIVLWDDELRRFGLQVKPTGAMTYVVQYRNLAGRTRKLALGRLECLLTPEEARIRALKALGRVADCQNPSAARNEARGALTMGQLCDSYLSAAEKGSGLVSGSGPRLRARLPPIEAGSSGISSRCRGRWSCRLENGRHQEVRRSRRSHEARVTGGRGAASRTVGLPVLPSRRPPR
jgi:hypothetical protein